MIPPDFFNNNYLFAEKARLFANPPGDIAITLNRLRQ